MSKLDTLLHIVDKINTWVARIMTVFVLCLFGVTLYGVIMRYIVHQPINWGGQVLMLIYIPVAVLAGGYVLSVKGHIRLDLLYGRWSPRRQAIIDVATFIMFLLFAGVLLWQGAEMAWTSTLAREVYQIGVWKGPVYPKKIAFALGFMLLFAQGLVQLIRDINFIRGREMRGLNSER